MANWANRKIGSFLRERAGRYDPSDKILDGLKRLKKIDFSGEIHLADKDSKTDMILAHPGDLVISGINVAKGAIAIYSGDKPVAATIHYSSYTFDKDEIDIEFFKRFIQSPLFEETLKTQVRGGIKTEIKAKNFLPLEISIPDLPTQKQIVLFFKQIEGELKELNNQIELQQQLILRLRRQILQDAIEGRLTAEWRKSNTPLISGKNHAKHLLEAIKEEKSALIQKGELREERPRPPINPAEMPFNLPEGWIWCRLGDIIISAKDGPHFSPEYSDSGIPFISTRNISPQGIDFSTARHITREYHAEISKKCKPEKWDILYTKGGTTGVARVNSYDAEFNVWVHVAVLKKPQAMNPFYIQNSLNSPHCYAQSQKLTHGIGNQDLGLTRMVNITVPLPPVHEQQAIVERLNILSEELSQLEKTIERHTHQSQLLMQSILREAFEK